MTPDLRPTRLGTLAITALLAGCGSDASGPGIDPRDPVGRVTLSHLPVDIEDVVAMQPLGNLNVLPEDHGGFYLWPDKVTAGEPMLPLYAPADGRIVHVRPSWQPELAPYGYNLAFTIRVSTTMEVSFGHLSDFTDEIWDALGEIEVSNTAAHDVDIPVTAGQVVAYMGTRSAIDWYIGDSELDLDFVNPSRYPGPWLYTGCYMEYYEGALRAQLEDLSLRDSEPLCGRTDFDVAGRIVGNWFLEGEVPDPAFNDYSTHLAIVYDEFQGARIAISDGIAMRPDSPHAGDEIFFGSRIFWVAGNGPAPETIGLAEGIVEYEIFDRGGVNFYGPNPPVDETPDGVFLVEMLAADRIRVERVMGATADEVDGFGANARVYVR